MRDELSPAWSLSRWGYYCDFVTVPLAIAITVLLAAKHGAAPGAFLSSALAGGLIWSLIEYLVHRFVFHGRSAIARQHHIHHQLPADFIGAGWWVTTPLLIVIGLVAPQLLGLSVGSGFYVGFLGWYLAYIAMHDVYHHGDVTRLPRMARHHNGHHRNGRSNFGVSTTLWDHVFGSKTR